MSAGGHPPDPDRTRLHRVRIRRSQVRATLSLSFLLLFAVADPLIGFVIYFCGWHSMRGLFRLYRQVTTTVLVPLLRYLLHSHNQ